MELTRLKNYITLEGSMAPSFSLPNQEEKWIKLDDLLANGPVMVVFYPGDFTMVCTKQLCAYQESIEDFQKFGIQIIGVSGNFPKEHSQFREKYQFTFPLLTDVNKVVTRAYGVTSLFMLGGTSRAVFIISKTGKILYRYVEPTRLSYRKPREILDKIEELKKSGQL